MTDMNDFRVIPFCSKVEEWPIWSERFLAKAKRCGFKDLLLGKLSIPKVDEEIDETSDIGKKKSIIIELNEIAYTEMKEIDVNKFHEMIGHCGVDRLKKNTNIHGLKLKGDFKVCEDCAVAKAR
jgi:hypothetical protein